MKGLVKNKLPNYIQKINKLYGYKPFWVGVKTNDGRILEMDYMSGATRLRTIKPKMTSKRIKIGTKIAIATFDKIIFTIVYKIKKSKVKGVSMKYEVIDEVGYDK